MASLAQQGAAGEEGGAPAPARRPMQSVPVRYCAVYDCLHNYRTHPHLSFFGFPSDKEMVKIWVEKIRRPDIVQANGHVSGYYRVCEAHFESKHINPNRRRRRLLRRAVPALRLPHAGSYVSVVEDAVPASQRPRLVAGRALVRSTMEVFEYVETSKRKRKRDDKSSLRPSTSAAPPELEDFSAECDRHLAPGMADFVKLIARLRQTDCSNGLDELCLKLLHSSPPAYRLLRTALGLPTIRSLHRQCISLLHDFDEKVMELLKTRVERMTEKERQCTLCVESIEVWPHLYYNITYDRIVGLHEVDGKQSPWPAWRVAAVSVRGLLAGWTQPVALSFLGREDAAFDRWLERIIASLTTLGLKIRALVSDPRAPAHAPAEPDHFFHVGDTKIYCIYDAPSLMSMLLCSFMRNDFHFERTTAKWNDVQEYLKLEKHKHPGLTPALTNGYLSSQSVQRMRARSAARLLNRTLAAALSSYLDRKLLPDSTLATVNLILKLNNLYDILDTDTMKGATNFKKGLFNNSGQVGFLEYMKSFFKSLKLENKCSNSYKMDHQDEMEQDERLSGCWQTTIASILALNEDMKAIKAPLVTRRLHLDDQIRVTARRTAKQRQRHVEPTCQQVLVAFKKHFLGSMLQSPNEEKSERFDLNSLLARVACEPSGRADRRVPEPEVEELKVRRREYCRVRLPMRDAALAAAALLLRAARREHGHCARARQFVREPPPEDLVELVRRLDAALAGALQQPAAPARALLRDLMLDVHVLDCALPCACFPLERLKLLFLRLRLFHLLQHNRDHFTNHYPDYIECEFNTLEYNESTI